MRPRTPLAAAFGRIVRTLRGNMPQVALANFAGIHLDRLAQLEAGVDDPTLEEIWRLAKALDIEASELVERTITSASSRAP